MLCHLAAFAGFFIPLGYVMGPLVAWLLKRNESALVDDQGRESVNFQISTTIYVLAIIILLILVALASLVAMPGDAAGAFIFSRVALFGLGTLAIAALVLFDIIAVVIAAVRTSGGELFRYPLNLRLIR